ncbi:Alpha-2C adrenergic receptor [Habropoda laboriosa]|uniref:Alpha-2C adrenergic receptor n=1 Tax=Habropoda laboriosa TaxID=597456 RepID=A0A0L7RJM2_9HYME|nr:Alpha-2C adrenergic receptor [Habropoda laboriosa]
MPLLDTIMTIDAGGSPTKASTTSVFEENMTWSRPTLGGSTSSTNLTDDEQLLLRLAAASTTTTTPRAVDQGPSERTAATGNNKTNNDTSVEVEEEEEGVSSGEGDCACVRSNLPSGTRLPFLEVDVITGEGSTVTAFENSTGVEANVTQEEDAEGLRELELLFGLGGMMEDLGGTFNNSFNESLEYACNGSLCNETTYRVYGESLYPSGYTLPQIILASILATLLMIVIVVGNMLVIIAIATEKALKNIQNWFIASLAVADFFLGLVIMPFSLANEIMGYWIFGYWWCDIYSAMDVLLCTASIMNLCLISLDRFWSITQAVKYLKKRTPARAALMIALVWLLSALVCIPPLLGWKRPTPAEEYPKCKVRNFVSGVYSLSLFIEFSYNLFATNMGGGTMGL